MITLRKNADRRVRRGHPWVFSNEIADPPVSELEPGSIHEMRDASGEFLGMVYANSAGLIAARILTRKKQDIDRDFLQSRIKAAIERRESLNPNADSYRLVFGESDLLPGLIVDRYGEYLAVQMLTAGMDRLSEDVIDSLVSLLAPAGIQLRNDSPSRALEGLVLEKKSADGSIPDLVKISCDGLTFLVDIANGQKTGFFLDQQANRPALMRYVTPGARMLDLFCYSGAWGVYGASTGAGHIVGVDTSRGALKLAQDNASINQVDDRFTTTRDSVVEFLKKNRDTWDLIVLDPPAFIKSRSKIKEGRKGYIDINRRALNRLDSGGILITCSCSYHLDLQDFLDVIAAASRQSGRELRLLEIRGQGPDHPVLLSMPETRYLKVVVAQVI
jgi:23S rRNA (cytosine1962-C5)-methyltransferase